MSRLSINYFSFNLIKAYRWQLIRIKIEIAFGYLFLSYTRFSQSCIHIMKEIYIFYDSQFFPEIFSVVIGWTIHHNILLMIFYDNVTTHLENKSARIYNDQSRASKIACRIYVVYMRIQFFFLSLLRKLRI